MSSDITESPLGCLAIIVIVVVFGVCSYRWNLGECERLMERARTSADSLVVLASRPIHNGLSCQSILNP